MGPLGISMRFLRAPCPICFRGLSFLVSGAIEAIRHLTSGAGLQVTPEFRARAFQAAVEAGSHILALDDPDIRARYREIRTVLDGAIKE